MRVLKIIPKFKGNTINLYETGIPLLGSNRWYTSPGNPGAGTGKGGGGGGSIREAGGGLGKYGTAQEEAYFRAKQKEELDKIKKLLKENPELLLKKDK